MNIKRIPLLEQDMFYPKLGVALIIATVIVCAALLIYFLIRHNDVWIDYNLKPRLVGLVFLFIIGIGISVLVFNVKDYKTVKEQIVITGYVESIGNKYIALEDDTDTTDSDIQLFMDSNDQSAITDAYGTHTIQKDDKVEIVREVTYDNKSELGNEPEISENDKYDDIVSIKKIEDE